MVNLYKKLPNVTLKGSKESLKTLVSFVDFESANSIPRKDFSAPCSATSSNRCMQFIGESKIKHKKKKSNSKQFRSVKEVESEIMEWIASMNKIKFIVPNGKSRLNHPHFILDNGYSWLLH